MKRILKIRANASRRVPGRSDPKSNQNVNKVKKKNSQQKIKSEIVFSELEATYVAGQGETSKKLN